MLPRQVQQYGGNVGGRCERTLWTDAWELSWQWTGNSLGMEHLLLKQAKLINLSKAILCTCINYKLWYQHVSSACACIYKVWHVSGAITTQNIMYMTYNNPIFCITTAWEETDKK